MYRVFANVPLKIDECIAFLSAGKGKGASNAWFLSAARTKTTRFTWFQQPGARETARPARLPQADLAETRVSARSAGGRRAERAVSRAPGCRNHAFYVKTVEIAKTVENRRATRDPRELQ